METRIENVRMQRKGLQITYFDIESGKKLENFIHPDKVFVPEAKMPKTFKIKTRYIVGRGNQADRENIVDGTLDYLNKYFSYTLEIGNSWNPKINRCSKTINAFVKNLQKSYEEKESACYNRTYVELLTSNN